MLEPYAKSIYFQTQMQDHIVGYDKYFYCLILNSIFGISTSSFNAYECNFDSSGFVVIGAFLKQEKVTSAYTNCTIVFVKH